MGTTIVSIGAFICVLIPPSTFWICSFIALTIPLLLIIQFFFLIYWGLKKNKQIILPLISLLVAYPFLSATLSFSSQELSENNLSVLSYNTRVFNVYDHLNKDFDSSKKMIDWVSKEDSDVKCFQEYYNDKKSPIFKTTQKIGNNAGYYHFVKPVVINHIGAEFGLAIFSKYPIVEKGVIDLQMQSTNSAIFADIKVNQDTIRIINIHLQSLSISEDDLAFNSNSKENYKNLFTKIKEGYINRDKQLANIETYLKDSPYKTIVCGDLNDTPYSYVYFRLKKYLNNAFEEAGTGFGFTYNGKLFFLRIDNQFYSEGLEATGFETKREVKFSDHFPIKVFYNLEN
ncbi:MAG: endonuclease/exonuclease/phosphatase family protein [Flammeovirgaceae bacterium]|nr:endonuclease/exonuclease/phosphatase family protein [Flammeovirgaceae bacterium]